MKHPHHSPKKALSRVEQRHLETRDEILRAARVLVEEHGADDLSMRALAERTGFTPPALYRYFPGGKNDVLEALAGSSLELLAAHFRRVSADLPPNERLMELAMVYLEFAREHRPELQLMLDSVGAMAECALDDDALLGPNGVFGFVFEALQEAAAAGAVKATDHDQLVLAFHGAWSLLHGMAVLEAIHPHHEALFRKHAQSLMQAFFDGLAGDWINDTSSSRPSRRNPERTDA